MSDLYILRSRFQPFSRIHLASVLRFLEEKRDEFKAHPCSYLVLGVVTDYEGLIRNHLPGVAAVQVRDFRHLPLFNPLSVLEVQRDIWDSINTYIEEHPEREDIGELLRGRTLVVPLHHRFTDLIEVLRSRGTPSQPAPPRGMREMYPRWNRWPLDARQALLGYNCLIVNSLALSDHGTDDATNLRRHWLIPLVDQEDSRDVMEVAGPEDAVTAIQVESGTEAYNSPFGSVGWYGLVSVYAKYRLEEHLNSTNVPMREEVTKEYAEHRRHVAQVERLLGQMVIGAVWQRFKRLLTIRIGRISQSVQARPGEFNQYRDHEFSRNAMGLMGALDPELLRRVNTWCRTNDMGYLATPARVNLNDVIQALRQHGDWVDDDKRRDVNLSDLAWLVAKRERLKHLDGSFSDEEWQLLAFLRRAQRNEIRKFLREARNREQLANLRARAEVPS